MKINWKYYAANCTAKGTTNACDCPLVVFENVDGVCRHKACEGPHPDCGKPVAIEEDHA